MCPFSIPARPSLVRLYVADSVKASLPAGEGPATLSPTAVENWHPRRKSVPNACERCRRRKIRCDGETPCLTCKRFTLQCVRAQKPRDVVASSVQSASSRDTYHVYSPIASEHREALEGRIKHLESQLAAHVSTPMHGMESIDQNLMASTSPAFDWQSPPHLNLDTNIPALFTVEDLDLGTFSAGSSMPSIAIDQCEPFPPLHPNSPVPSSWSGTTGPSSPDMPSTSALPQYANRLPYLSSVTSFASPMEPPTTESWDFMTQTSSTHLQPGTASSRGHSRRTSASSLSLDSEESAMSAIPEVEDDILPLAPVPRLPRQGIFAAQHTESPGPTSSRSSFTDRSRALATTPLPSRFEAETLTTAFIHHIESLDYTPYLISPSLFTQLYESVYPNPQRNSAIDIPASMPMARFHVFLAMAVAMKLRIKDSPEPTNALLDTCYELAMQQASSPTFWQEFGGVEAAQLLVIFAAIQKTLLVEPKPLQTSFSW